MKRLLLVASKAGYQTEAFTAAAARLELDVRLDLATNRCHHLEDPWRDGALAVDFENPVLERQAWDGITAVGDQATVVAARLAGELGLPYHPLDAVQACRSKFEMRERFRRAGLLTPRYERVTERVCGFEFPCVLKPLGLSASRGVIRADNQAEFDVAYGRIRRMLAQTPDLARDPQSAFIQIEEFIPGQEFAIEGLVTAGLLQVLAIFDKPDPLDGPFFEETIYTTPSREAEPVQEAIREAAQRAVTALGLWHGPVHAECRVNARGVWMLEAAGRPIGGLCARVLRFESGMGLEEVIIRHALGLCGFVRLAPGEAAVMMIPIPRGGIYQGVTGLEEARAGVESIEITAVPGQLLVPLPEGASYLGFIFARGEGAEQAVREAHGKLRFEVLTALPLLKV